MSEKSSMIFNSGDALDYLRKLIRDNGACIGRSAEMMPDEPHREDFQNAKDYDRARRGYNVKRVNAERICGGCAVRRECGVYSVVDNVPEVNGYSVADAPTQRQYAAMARDLVPYVQFLENQPKEA